MSAAKASSLIYSWATVRYELLNTRISEMGLHIEGSPIEAYTRRVCHEVASKALVFQPHFYLTDSWGCPDEVPVVGIPFYLADKRLSRIEEEQTGEIETPSMILMFLRHEVGHAINYAYRLWQKNEWADTFGPFSKPYRDSFRPNAFSRQFVRHLISNPYGRTYAQKHPDEDFAETFAIWLTPRSAWRRKYRQWPALKKLLFVDRLMRQIRGKDPVRTDGARVTPVEQMTLLLAEHYGQRAERFRAAAQGYVDDKLREIFPTPRSHQRESAACLIQDHEGDLIQRIARWSEQADVEIQAILDKLKDRATALELTYARRDTNARLIDLTALATSMAMNFAHTGSFA